MSILSCLNNKYELLIILINLTFFMTVQTIFFKYIGSIEFEKLVLQKGQLIKNYISTDEKMLNDFNNFKNNYIKENKKIANEQKIIREKKNNNIYLLHCIIPIILIVILAIIIYFSSLKGEWNNSTLISILSITLTYIPELFLFFFIMTKYQHISNMNIITKMYKNLL